MTTTQPILDLRGRRALVTGSSRGIGAATVRLLAAAGADVAIGYRNRAAAAEQVAESARGVGARAFTYAADIGTRAGAEALVEAAARDLGGIDLFVGNAGVWPTEPVTVGEIDDERWSSTLRENLDSIFFTTRAVARIITDGGRIVLLSSTAGQRGEAYHADYAATKGAIISLTKSLAVELGSRDITVNCVAPGWVDTKMVENAVTGEGMASIARSIPLGRIASPEDIAGPIVFLCSAFARHITGEVVNVNGGSVLCG